MGHRGCRPCLGWSCGSPAPSAGPTSPCPPALTCGLSPSLSRALKSRWRQEEGKWLGPLPGAGVKGEGGGEPQAQTCSHMVPRGSQRPQDSAAARALLPRPGRQGQRTAYTWL